MGVRLGWARQSCRLSQGGAKQVLRPCCGEAHTNFDTRMCMTNSGRGTVIRWVWVEIRVKMMNCVAYKDDKREKDRGISRV